MNLIEIFIVVYGLPIAAIMGLIYATKRTAFKAIRTRNRWKLVLWCLRWPVVAYKAIMDAAEVEMAKLKDLPR